MSYDVQDYNRVRDILFRHKNCINRTSPLGEIMELIKEKDRRIAELEVKSHMTDLDGEITDDVYKILKKQNAELERRIREFYDETENLNACPDCYDEARGMFERAFKDIIQEVKEAD